MTDDELPRATKTNVYAKWGDAALAGFQPVPDLLLRKQRELSISTTDLVVLLNILMHWWYADHLPFARPTVIARRMGLNVRTVQRSVRDLEALGFIRKCRDMRGYSVFDPLGLVEKLGIIAQTDPHYLARRKADEDRQNAPPLPWT